MKVRILKANKGYWYAKYIGEIFDVYEWNDADGDYRLILDDNLYVKYQDAEVIKCIGD